MLEYGVLLQFVQLLELVVFIEDFRFLVYVDDIYI